MRRKTCACCSVVLCLSALLGAVGVYAQADPLSVLLPSRARRTVPSGTEVRLSTASVSSILSFSRPIGDRQSLRLSTEFVRMSPAYVKIEGGGQPEWKFKGVPITLGYEYTLRDEQRRMVPFVGVGVSCYLSQASQRFAEGASVPVGTGGYAREYGVGYGTQASLGLRTNLSPHLSVVAEGRYRLVNGLALRGQNPDQAEFPMFDFAVGFGFTF